jgi:hypothetical protein
MARLQPCVKRCQDFEQLQVSVLMAPAGAVPSAERVADGLIAV